MNDSIRKAKEIITGYSGKPLRIMEVCGTHTHEIFRLGIRRLLPESIDLISGPGCPVCVTAVGFIDEACWLALEKSCIICTFGDLIRVPGTTMNLSDARAKGADIRPVYSPLDAVQLAQDLPDRQIVFLAVGFETTIPAACLAAKQAKEKGLQNFSLLTANKTMPNAYQALVGSADAFLYPGHVNAISGNSECIRLCEEQGVSGVVAGFTSAELLTALAVTVNLLQKGKPFFRNSYPRVVSDEGNPAALKLIAEVMEPCDSEWRGLGMIKGSGMKLRADYADFDARLKFNMPQITGKPNPACRCGDVLQGKCKPSDCKVYGKVCTPLHPIGACMVSDEGACAAYYQYS